MAKLFEYYNTGDDNYDEIFSQRWLAQTFTPVSDHKITSVKLKLSRSSPCDNLIVGIRATNANGYPTGSDLASGSLAGSALTGTPTWYEITLGSGTILNGNTKYAIVLRSPGSTGNPDRVRWSADSSSPTYAGGNLQQSNNWGATWTDSTGWDTMFEDWGECYLIASPGNFTLTSIATSILRAHKMTAETGSFILTSIETPLIKKVPWDFQSKNTTDWNFQSKS